MYHITKGWGMQAVLFPDETNYNYAIRLQDVQEFEHPLYLYYSLYGFIKWFGSEFLEAARVANGIIFCLSGFFIYRIARLGCSHFLAVFITALALVMPPSLVTLFLMPDALYHTIFWCIAWFALMYRHISPKRYALICGAGFGALSLVKVHAIFLLAGFAVFLILRNGIPATARKAGKQAGLALLSILGFCIVKFTAGFLVAGTSGLTLLGTNYNQHTALGLQQMDWGDFIGKFLFMFPGHVMGLALVFGLPILLLIQTMTEFRRTPDANNVQTALLAICQFVPMIVVSALFSIFNSFTFLNYDVGYEIQIQARYYYFLYPFFLIVCGYAYSSAKTIPRVHLSKVSLYSSLLLLGLALAAIVTRMSAYRLDVFPHYPSVAGLLNTGDWLLSTFIASALLAVPALWIIRRDQRIAGSYLMYILPVYLVFVLLKAQIYINKEMMSSTLYKIAVESAKDYLGDEVAQSIFISKPELIGYEVTYHLDDKNIEHHIIHHREQASAQVIKPRHKWMVLIGDVHFPQYDGNINIPLGIATKGANHVFKLIRLAPYSFSTDLSPGKKEWPVIRIQYAPEEVAIAYTVELPRAFTFSLDADTEDGDTVYEVEITGLDAPIMVTGSGKQRHEYEVSIDKPGRTIWIRKPEGYEGEFSPPLRLELVPAKDERAEEAEER